MKTERSLKPSWRWTFLISLVLVGTGMRLFRLTHWGLEGDELFTLRDSLTADVFAIRPKALLFILNHYLVAPFLGLDELGLRILPLAFGLAGIVAVYFLASRLLGPRAGLFSALLVTFAPWHLYWSQNARYHSLVFLLSAGVPVALYLGVGQEKIDLGWVALATLLAMLAVLAHPSAALVAAGCLLWLAGSIGLKVIRGRSTSPRLVAVAAGLLILFAVASVHRLGPMLLRRYENPEEWGIAGPLLLMSYGNWITAGVALFCAGGLVWMWRDESRELALLIACAIGVPFLTLASLGYVLPVSVGYLFATAPFVLMAAGYFLARLSSLGTNLFSRTLIGGTCALALVAGGVPSILSHYMNGGRPDSRGAARFIDARAQPADLVVADLRLSLDHYLSAAPVKGFRRDPADLDSKLDEISQDDRRGTLWIVPLMQRRAGFNDLGLGAAGSWVWEHCVLDAVIAHPRLDYKIDDLHVYRCDSDGSLATSVEN